MVIVAVIVIIVFIYAIVSPNMNPCPRCNAMKHDKGTCARCGYSSWG